MYTDKQPEVFDSIPYDIDGFNYYLVKTNDDEWNEKQRDRQHFIMGTAPRKGFLWQEENWTMFQLLCLYLKNVSKKNNKRN